ncbi:MAG: nucleotidyltransferase domain-containing protein [Myxococcota bacterium]
MAPLTEQQARVVARVMVEEDSRRRHLVVAISGAHAYGFPSPDSDVDLKAIHVAPTTELLGLSPPALHASRLEVVDGVEIDYSSNEIQPVLQGILTGNGNYVERVLGNLRWSADPLLDELRPLVARALTRQVHRHYHGFAQNQLKALQTAGQKTAKKALYVLRTTLTGSHLLLTREVQPDVTVLMDHYGFGDARDLVQRKTAGERVALSDEEATLWLKRIEAAFDLLADALRRSPLPDEAPNRDEVRAWLVELRRRELRA